WLYGASQRANRFFVLNKKCFLKESAGCGSRI
ncbi:MAG: hypothetical protein ACI95X_001879, partial [Paraglaciecola sp.]